MMTASTAASFGYLTEQPLQQKVSVQTKLTFFPFPTQFPVWNHVEDYTLGRHAPGVNIE
jgi:hypothetical protein